MVLLEKFILKLLWTFVRFLRFSFFTFVSVKAFSYWLDLYTFLSVDLLYDISILWYLFTYLLLIIYFIYLFNLIFEFKRSQMFFITLNIMSVFHNIKYYGLMVYTAAMYRQIIFWGDNLFKIYWSFRKLISPRKSNLLLRFRSIFNNISKDHKSTRSNKGKTDEGEWITKFKEHSNCTNVDYIKKKKSDFFSASAGTKKKKKTTC